MIKKKFIPLVIGVASLTAVTFLLYNHFKPCADENKSKQETNKEEEDDVNKKEEKKHD